MNDEEFDEAYDKGEMDAAYAEYIQARPCGDRLICNGDQLLRAMEDGYLLDDFKESLK